MGEKGQLFLIENIQSITVEGKMEIENHHLQTPIIVIIVAGKNHQWILKSAYEDTMITRIYI